MLDIGATFRTASVFATARHCTLCDIHFCSIVVKQRTKISVFFFCGRILACKINSVCFFYYKIGNLILANSNRRHTMVAHHLKMSGLFEIYLCSTVFCFAARQFQSFSNFIQIFITLVTQQGLSVSLKVYKSLGCNNNYEFYLSFSTDAVNGQIEEYTILYSNH